MWFAVNLRLLHSKPIALHDELHRPWRNDLAAKTSKVVKDRLKTGRVATIGATQNDTRAHHKLSRHVLALAHDQFDLSHPYVSLWRDRTYPNDITTSACNLNYL